MSLHFAPFAAADAALDVQSDVAAASHLIFAVRDALYAVPAFAVREVLAPPPITPLHELPPLFRGVAHLREQFVPVLDLHRCLGAPVSTLDAPAVLVVLESANRLLAIAVDEVRDVRPLPSHSPRFGARFESNGSSSNGSSPHGGSPHGGANCLAGVVRLDDQNLQLLHLPGFFDLIAPFSAGIEALVPAPRAAAEIASAAEAPLVAVVRLGHELFGLPIMWVCEFAPLRAVTPIPGASRAVVGLMNLRGEVLSLLDIRPALQLPAPAADSAEAAPEASQVVVVECDDWRVGLVVDEVLDVFGLPGDAIIAVGAGEILTGTAWFDFQMLGLLDVPRLLSQERQELGEV